VTGEAGPVAFPLMISRETASSGPTTAGAAGMTVPGAAAVAAPPTSSGAVLRTDLLHRHLSARVAAARETLDILEARTPAADDKLVHWFAARVAEAQEVLDQERAEAQRRRDERLAAARRRATTIVIDAEGEARVLRSVAAQLGQAPVGAPIAGDLDATDEVVVDVRDDAVVELGRPETVVAADPAAP
jgi:hypothetical protein